MVISIQVLSLPIFPSPFAISSGINLLLLENGDLPASWKDFQR